jgi:6-phosphogluconate dehydrogenase
MGGNISRRLMKAGHHCVVFDVNVEPRSLPDLGISHAPRVARAGMPAPSAVTFTPARPARGHFIKMVHNGIEYGTMQTYAEGFDILRNKDSNDLPGGQRYALNRADIAEVWRRCSVISSWLLDLGAAALAKDPQLEDFSGFVQDSGDGFWLRWPH